MNENDHKFISRCRHPYQGADAGGYWGFVQAIRGQQTLTPTNCSVELQEFISSCLQQNAKDRPSAGDLLQHAFLVNNNMGIDGNQLAKKLALGRCASRPNAELVDDSIRWLRRQSFRGSSGEDVSSHTSKSHPDTEVVEVSQILESIKDYYITVWKSAPCTCHDHRQEMVSKIHELTHVGVMQALL